MTPPSVYHTAICLSCLLRPDTPVVSLTFLQPRTPCPVCSRPWVVTGCVCFSRHCSTSAAGRSHCSHFLTGSLQSLQALISSPCPVLHSSARSFKNVTLILSFPFLKLFGALLLCLALNFKSHRVLPDPAWPDLCNWILPRPLLLITHWLQGPSGRI